MNGTDPVRLVAQLADTCTREAAAGELARALGVDRVLLFVRDPELGSLLPAEGFPQTLRAGAAWRAFVRGCSEPGRYEADVGEVDGAGPDPHVVAYVEADSALFLFGRPTADAELLEVFLGALPLVGAMLRAEYKVRLAEADAALARATGRHANDLATALDAARVDVERALAESARLNAELEERDRRKDDFLAMLGHELRNPMAAISGAIEVLRLEAGDPSQVRKARAILERQAEQLAHLVDDLLDVARITRGKVVLRPEVIEVGVVVQRAVDAARAAADAKGHRLSLEVRRRIEANADRTRLEQIVTNLLTNATKYTDPGGHIRVLVDEEDGNAVISVADDGIGIPEHLLPRVFEAFHQVDPAIDRGAGGLGIGLTVASRLAALHQGRIDVTSAVGVGSTFSLRIPARDGPNQVAVEEPTPGAPEAREAGGPLRILVVDDNLDSAEMLSALLASWGHETHVAGDGPSAILRAKEMRPDVVLLDIGLPGMNGFAVAARLRDEPATANVRILALSGYGQESDRLKSRAAGCEEHLVKPVDIALLKRLLVASDPPAGAAVSRAGQVRGQEI